MNRVGWQSINPDQVDPGRLSLLLERHGWVQRGGQAGMYSRWALPEEGGISTPASLLLPLNTDMADYADLLHQAVAKLQALAPTHHDTAEEVLAGLVDAPGDEVRFCKEVATVLGAVAWPLGEDLIKSARDALLATAKAQVSKRAYHGNKSGRFAHRYLESVLMGQTDLGSYVVTAYTPVDQVFHEREPKPYADPLPFIGAHTGREITESFVLALEATQEALEHFQRRASLSGFEDAVTRGVSRELASAIRGMVLDADGAEVRVEWSPLHPPESQALGEQSVSFEFNGGVAPVLERAIERLSTLTPTEYIRATGWVTVVARPKRGQPGLIRLKVHAGSVAKTLRVRLSDEQFEVAARAIAEEQALSVSGRQEKDGRTYWLYDATNVAIAEPPPSGPGPSAGAEPGPGQYKLEG